MPNWCNVQVRILGPEDERQRFLNGLNKDAKDAWSGELSVLGAYHPIPEDIGDNWYEWSIINWGTKWVDDMFVINAADFGEPDDTDYLHLSGATAWSPPIAGYKFVSQKFPNLTFEMGWDEGGMCFMGAAIIKNGQVTGFSETSDKEYPSCEDWDDSDQVDAFMQAVNDGREQCMTEALQEAGSSK